MAVFNDGHDNQEDYKADLAWEYRKGGPNDPNLYAEEEPEEDAEEEAPCTAEHCTEEGCKNCAGYEPVGGGKKNPRSKRRDTMRLIDADKVKATAREDCKDCIMNGSVYCKRECFINRVCDYIDAQPTAEARPHGEWIAVKDKYPDTEGFYLVSLENGRIVVADERSIIENHDFEPRMMAWQPLPEPYRAEVDT